MIILIFCVGGGIFLNIIGMIFAADDYMMMTDLGALGVVFVAFGFLIFLFVIVPWMIYDKIKGRFDLWEGSIFK